MTVRQAIQIAAAARLVRTERKSPIPGDKIPKRPAANGDLSHPGERRILGPSYLPAEITARVHAEQPATAAAAAISIMTAPIGLLAVDHHERPLHIQTTTADRAMLKIAMPDQNLLFLPLRVAIIDRGPAMYERIRGTPDCLLPEPSRLPEDCRYPGVSSPFFPDDALPV
jgi:hypothetical protein